MDADGLGAGISRRALGSCALGAGLVLRWGRGSTSGTGGVDVAGYGTAGRGPVLRRGSAEEAGLVPERLEAVVAGAGRFLGPSPTHPWYAGAVVLAGRGGIVALHRAIGYAVRYAAYDETTGLGVGLRPERRVPMRRDTVCDLASLTKLFTSVLAVRSVECGELGLEERVAARLPPFGRGGKGAVTVRQLLTHTSGLRAWLPLYREATRSGRLRLLWDEVPEDPPGTAYRYSDLNLIVLQLLLEEVTGRPLDVLLRERVTGPLGLRRTRFAPPGWWRPWIAATEDARPPWSGLDRGMVWGEVHDENAYASGGVAGHAGVFSCARDLAVLARALLNGGGYGRARILRPESVELLFTDFNGAFPGHAHGLGFELGQRWYMGAMTTPYTAGHTGFTGTSLVLDRHSDLFLVLLGNSVHPVRTWRSGSAPRVAVADRLARAVPVRPVRGRTAWGAGAAGDAANRAAGSLTLPVGDAGADGARLLSCAVWWDTVPDEERLFLEAGDGAGVWRAVPFATARAGGGGRRDHAEGAVSGWSGRVWHRVEAALPPWARLLRWRYGADGRHRGRGVYVDGLRVLDRGRVLFDEARPEDAGRIVADGWTASAD
ncbi:serine hydrolase [Streptomyces sp. MUM 203J]|uniref:serine hydrolase n=1 Tax=Streptomyces sp. MUM 203J TaxID=2791990 RepID=UPI001F0422A6|nr:serine hydrolase [Streptomyces sp. MUM 203J]MCH0542985.1 serine hydrolase [Streptomyces sp. MUM 203J]